MISNERDRFNRAKGKTRVGYDQAAVAHMWRKFLRKPRGTGQKYGHNYNIDNSYTVPQGCGTAVGQRDTSKMVERNDITFMFAIVCGDFCGPFAVSKCDIL